MFSVMGKKPYKTKTAVCVCTMGSIEEQFKEIPRQYEKKEDLPHYKLEYELVKRAIGDCTGYRVLEIAGGIGDYAYHALERGATHADVVDGSPEKIEAGRSGKNGTAEGISWHCASVTAPLWEIRPILPLAGYDLVLAIWAFEDAGTFEEYFTLYRNIATYLKPGGRFVLCRVANPWSASIHDGQYGAKTALIEQTSAHGVRCEVLVNTNPPYSIESHSTEQSLRGDPYVPERLGLVDFQLCDPTTTEEVKSDPGFWKEFVDDPYFVILTARKKSS